LLKQVGVRRGVIHAFSGSLQQAENYMSQGFLLGAGGILSYQKATRVKAVFSQIPLNCLVLETDAPDMPLQDKRGQRNSPEYIPEIASLLADIKQETLDTIATKTTENVQTLFSI
jgi:TatD DNase family protein